MSKLRPMGHPILDKLTWRIKEPSRLLPNLPYPKGPFPQTLSVWHSDGRKTKELSYETPRSFYDWLDNFVLHQLDSARLRNRLLKRAVSRLTCFLYDTSLGVYDDIDDERWETTRVI